MNYNEALDRLNKKGKFGKGPGLERITTLLNKMDNPQNNLKFIHIAGTNGKGSTSTMLSNVLIHSGYKTGLFISPYVICFRERMQINGEMISETEFAEIADYVYNCEANTDYDEDSFTHFETITAIAFEWFKRKKCDYICLEVGMGGRFDPTNVILQPILQIITSISYDHTAVLGNKIDKIAFEKAGIIKGGTTILYPLQENEALEVINKKCVQAKSKLVIPDLSQLVVNDNKWQKINFSYDELNYNKSLTGEFQIYNSLTVIEACKELQKQNINIDNDDIKFGIENTYFPARLEVLSKNPLIILDGSHNQDGAKALEKTLKNLKDYKITMIMGVLEDKSYNSILECVAKYASEFIAVSPNSPRALSSKELSQKAKCYNDNVYSFDDIEQAFNFATKKTDENNAIIVCGSLYLASEIRPIILDYVKSL